MSICTNRQSRRCLKDYYNYSVTNRVSSHILFRVWTDSFVCSVFTYKQDLNTSEEECKQPSKCLNCNSSNKTAMRQANIHAQVPTVMFEGSKILQPHTLQIN